MTSGVRGKKPVGGVKGEDALSGDRRFQLLVTSVTDYAIYMLDLDGRVVSWNEGARRLKGYTEPEIVGQHFSRFYTEEDRAGGAPARALEAARTSGRYEREGWRVRKDGTHFWASVVIDPIYDENGTLVGYAKVTRDLTERREAQEALRESERRFRLLVEGVVDYSLFMLDAEGRVNSWNTGAQRIKGYAAHEIIGQHFSRFYTEEDRAAGVPQEALRTAAREGKFEHEGWRVRKDGTRFFASVVIDAIRDENGALLGFAKITRDITERRRTQEALDQAREALHQSQKMETVGRLTGGVAHDFNNLLTVINGSLDLIVRETNPERLARIHRFARSALRAAERGATLTQQLLSFSRRQALNPETIEPNALVTEFRSMAQRAVGETVQVRMDLAPDIWSAHVDPAHFETALLNLVVNSRDAMPGGGILTIATRNTQLSQEDVVRIPDLHAGQYVRVTISDTGEGMTPDVKSRALEPFFTTKEVGVGSGLGLSQVYGFVRQSGGQVVIESEPGKGTEVHLFLPRSHELPAHVESAMAAGVASQAGQVVLVVEDNPDVLELAIEILHDLGFEVITASDGSQAISVLERIPVDLLFTDVVMPGMNGVELARKAREMRPGIKVVLTSGYAETMLKKQGVTAEFPLIIKPYRQADLAEKLRAG